MAEGRRAGLAAAASLGAIPPERAQALLRETPVPARRGRRRAPTTTGGSGSAPRCAAGGWDILACQCEEVTRGELVGVQPPRYLGAAVGRRCAPGTSAP